MADGAPPRWARSMAPYALSTALSGAVSLLSVVVLSRLMTPEAYGVFATVLTVATFGQILGFLWLQSSLLRLHATAADPARAAALAGAVRLGFAIAAVATAACWALGMATVARAARDVPGADAAAWWGLAVLLLRAWVGMAQAGNRAAERPWRYAVTDAGQGVGGTALAAAGAALWHGAPAAALAGLAGGALLGACASPELLRRGPGASRRPLLRELFDYGAPLSLSAVAAMALASADRLLVARLLGPAAVGVYAVAYGIAERSITLVLSAITLATKPLVFREYETHGAEGARRVLHRVAAQLMAVGFPTAVALAGAPGLVSDVLIGARMAAGAAALLPWLAPGALGAALLTLHFAVPLQLARRPWRTLGVSLPAAAVNVAANVLLLPRFGVVAATWTTLLGYATALALVAGLTRGGLRAPFPLADAARTVAACLPLAAWLRLPFPHTPAGLAAMVVGGTAVYGASALLLDVAGARREAYRLARG